MGNVRKAKEIDYWRIQSCVDQLATKFATELPIWDGWQQYVKTPEEYDALAASLQVKLAIPDPTDADS